MATSRLITPPLESQGTTYGGTGTLATDAREAERNRAGWQVMIDERLVEWGRNPNQFDEEDFVAPDAEVLERACRIAMCWRDDGWPAPLRVVPDGEGGIAFERRSGSVFEALTINSDGTTELVVFRDCVLESRVVLT